MAARPGSQHAARKEIAAYLRAQTPPLHAAVEANKQWAKQLPALYESVKAAKGQVAAVRARSMGRQYGAVFRKSLEQAEKLEPPPPAVRCQEYLVRWLKCLINACDSLVHAPEDGKDSSYLRDCHDYLDDARYAVKPLTEIRQRLFEAAQGKPPATSSPNKDGSPKGSSPAAPPERAQR